jgi:hypothetical protein
MGVEIQAKAHIGMPVKCPHLLDDRNESYSMCRECSSCPRYEGSWKPQRSPWYKPECTLIFMSSALNYSPLATKRMWVLSQINVFILTKIPLPGAELQAKTYLRPHASRNYWPTATIFISSVGNVRRAINMAFHDYPSNGSRDTSQTVHWSSCKVPLITDRSQRNLLCR